MRKGRCNGLFWPPDKSDPSPNTTNRHQPICTASNRQYLGQVQVHLVPVKVGVEGAAAALVEAECAVRPDLGRMGSYDFKGGYNALRVKCTR